MKYFKINCYTCFFLQTSFGVPHSKIFSLFLRRPVKTREKWTHVYCPSNVGRVHVWPEPKFCSITSVSKSPSHDCSTKFIDSIFFGNWCFRNWSFRNWCFRNSRTNGAGPTGPGFSSRQQDQEQQEQEQEHPLEEQHLQLQQWPVLKEAFLLDLHEQLLLEE